MLANTTEKSARPAAVAMFWFGIQTVWGAVLGLSLQARTHDLGGSEAVQLVGWIVAIGGTVAAITQIIAGVLADRRRGSGSRGTGFYIVGTILGSLGIAWFYFAPTFLELLIGFAVIQMGLNIAIGAYQAIIPDTIEPQRTGLASSWMAALQSAGNAVGALLAGLVFQTRIVAGTLIAILIASCAVTVAHVRRRPMHSIGEAAVATPVGNFANLFGSRVLLYAGFYTLLLNVYFAVRNLAVRSDDVYKLQSGIVVLLFTLFGVLGALLASRASDRADKRAVASAGGIVFGAAVVALPFVGTFGLFAAVAVIAGAGWGVVLVADWALACRILPGKTMATSMAAWNLSILLPQIVAPLLVNFALARSGSSSGSPALHVIFTIAAIESCLGILWIWRLPRALARE